MKQKIGIVVQNLGSPDSPTRKSLKPYLKEFLMDPLVIDVPWLLRYALVNFIITPFRAKKSAHAYSSVWTEKGSPLVVNSTKFCQDLEAELKLPVLLTMRYGKLNPKYLLEDWLNKNQITQVLFVPLYPQYALSSSQSSIDDFKTVVRGLNKGVQVEILKDFFKEEAFLNEIAKSVTEFKKTYDFDHLILSYHGLPQRHLMKAVPENKECSKLKTCCDTLTAENQFCYKAACLYTSREVVKKLSLGDGKHSTSFQSRLGSGWITPFTDEVLVELAKNGVKKLAVVTPSFAVDCLETLEEIGMRANEDFVAAGGESLKLIPCLNDGPEWVTAMAKILTSRVNLQETPTINTYVGTSVTWSTLENL